MPGLALPVRRGLAGSSRLPVLAQQDRQLQLAEVVWLLMVGSTAACAAAFLDFGLRIPGHAIIRPMLPMALGLAVAPRQMAGTVMGTGALATALLLRVGWSGAIGAGAITSLALVGPLMDLALWGAGGGWRLYLRFALWGLACNLAALTVRAGVKLFAVEGLGKRPFDLWFSQAVVTYVVCGVFAGLLSAWICFRFQEPGAHDGQEEPER